MKWFKHDSAANMDAKLRKVRMKYGMEGYGLYWYCVEMVAQGVDKNNLTFELEHDAELISHDTGIYVDRINEMMAYMCDLGLFNDSCGVIKCLSLAKRTDEYTAKLLIRMGDLACPDSVPTKSELREQNRTEQNRLEKNKNPCVPYQKIVDAYNANIGDDFPKVQRLSDKRKRVLKKFWTVIDKDLDKATRYFGYFAASAGPFYRGQESGNWKADIEYICREDTVIKAMEGRL